MPRLTIVVALALVASLALALAACDGDDEPPAPTATSTPPAATAMPTQQPTVAPAPGATPFEGAREPVAGTLGVRSGIPPIGLLVDVRTARHEGFDRIVFEFSGAPPDYHLAYVEPPIVADPSGLPIEIAGDAFLWVRFEPANAHDDDGNPTFPTGQLTPSLPTLLEVERAGDFEAVVIYVLGLRVEADFRVAALTDPLRLAIDVEHP